jgi:hypothetical protein
MGLVEHIDPVNERFSVRCQDDTVFDVFISRETAYWVLRNLDGSGNDRVPNPDGFDGTPGALLRKYLREADWRSCKAFPRWAQVLAVSMPE